MADQRADVLARAERHAVLPQRDAGEVLAARRVAARGQLVAVEPRGRRLADVVEQHRGRDDRPRGSRTSAAYARAADERLDAMLRVRPDVALGVERRDPAASPRGPRPARSPRGRLDRAPSRSGHRLERGQHHRLLANRSTPSASRFGMIGRASQWLPDSTTAVRKLARTHL